MFHRNWNCLIHDKKKINIWKKLDKRDVRLLFWLSSRNQVPKQQEVFWHSFVSISLKASLFLLSHFLVWLTLVKRCIRISCFNSRHEMSRKDWNWIFGNLHLIGIWKTVKKPRPISSKINELKCEWTRSKDILHALFHVVVLIAISHLPKPCTVWKDIM